jgi:hypothetical protein
MLRTLLLVAVYLTVHATSITFTLQCDQYPGPCNNKCYATYVAGKPASFSYVGPLGKPAKRKNRDDAGTTNNPCTCRKVRTAFIDSPSFCYDPLGAQVDCISPDEYPYASTPLGGQASGSNIIRCTGYKENVQEGRHLSKLMTTGVTKGGCGLKPCQIDLAFANVDNRRCVSYMKINSEPTLRHGVALSARLRLDQMMVLSMRSLDNHFPWPKEVCHLL